MAQISSKEFFSKLNSQTMHLVDDFYDENATFKDPLGEITGSKKLRDYYTTLYQGAEYVRFDFTGQMANGNEEVLFWNMTLKSKNLNSGNEYTVSGNSHFLFSPETKKCTYHRDYFDMGDFVYERLPIIKNLINFIKKQMKAHE
jgi:hypothetical protein